MKKFASILIISVSLIFIYSCSNEDPTPINNNNTGAPNMPLSPFPPADTTLHPGYHVAFSWTGGTHTANDTIWYDLYLDVASPASTLLAGNLRTEAYDWGIPEMGSYYWRVVAKNQRGQTTSGVNWHFYVDTLIHP